MKILVVYHSLTGNTKKVAEALTESLPQGTILSPLSEAPEPEGFDLIFFGFWVDRAKVCKPMEEYMERVKSANAAFFFTQVGWPHGRVAKKITLETTEKLKALGSYVLGTFHCQGRMDEKIIAMARRLPPTHPRSGFSFAKSALLAESELHPDREDLEKAAQFAQSVLREYQCLSTGTTKVSVDRKAKVLDWLNSGKYFIVSIMAGDLGLTDLEAIEALPPQMVRKAPAEDFKSLWETLALWPSALFLAVSPAAVVEVKGPIPLGTFNRDMYNIHDPKFALNGHLLYQKISQIFLLAKNFEGRDSLAVHFLTKEGQTGFAVYAGRGPDKTILREARESFLELWNLYS
ncbi:MAG: heme utilization cystosolic carrier protein HutX [Deltaproteobacteria bacterium]|jgi:putative heme utilization carrier protein HutX|nr:heme utilization cystosolic carrier protein HutX [Deltaproteobacteria bacterium]